jgi:hypothetical protein
VYGNLENLLGFFLLRVRRDDLKRALCNYPPNTAKLLVGENRCPQQRLPQRLALQKQGIAVSRRNHARVVRKLSIDELRHELH